MSASESKLRRTGNGSWSVLSSKIQAVAQGFDRNLYSVETVLKSATASVKTQDPKAGSGNKLISIRKTKSSQVWPSLILCGVEKKILRFNVNQSYLLNVLCIIHLLQHG